MTRVNKYDTYKDSGIEWVGEIPTTWQKVRLRFLCNIQTGDKDTVNKVDDGMYPFYVRSPIVERINTYTFDGEAILTAGDGGGAGKVFHYVTGKFDYHQRVYNLHNFKRIFGKFLYLYLKENFYKEIEKSNAKSTVDSIRLPMLLDFPVVFPVDTVEQQVLADYLDKKCGEIDKVVETEKAVIELLKEYKQSVITEAVTKGLDKSVPLKDSGIEWIGKIPQHLEVRKLKTIGNYRNGLTYSPEDICEKENGTLVLRSSNIQDGQLLLNDNVYVSSEIPGVLKVQKNDILICSRNGSRDLIGKNTIIDNDIEASFGAFMMIFRCTCPKYMYYILNSHIFNYYLGSFFTSTINQLTGKNFGGMNIVYCSQRLEQQQIADYLDKKCSEIDKAITGKEQLIEKLTEYKKSLIYECVTGKRKVV